MLSRRRFLTLASGTGVVLGAGGLASRAAMAGRATSATSSTSSTTSTSSGGGAGAGGRTLVVVELKGGNDGLGTVVPLDGRLRDARPTLVPAEGDLLRPAGLDGYGLHPSLQPIVPLWEAGRIAAVQNLGYAHPGRSHFECQQHWWDGAPPHEPTSTGWLGRWLDATAPSGEQDPLRAIALGGIAPALRAERATSTAILDPAGFSAGMTASALLAATDPRSSDAILAAAQDAVVNAHGAAEALAGPLSAATSTGSTEQRSLRADLALAAELVVAGLGIEVVALGGGGFDTHAAQTTTHASLLGDLAAGLADFWATIDAAGLSDQVLVVTTSEFGRRVAENGSAGTDHGLGSCQFAVGPVQGGVVGDVDLVHLHDGDVMPNIDPRSLFATAVSWLGGPVDEVLAGYEDLGLL